QHARRVGVAVQDPDWLSRLDEQGLVVTEPLQARDDAVKRRPVACGLARAAVHDQVLWPLGDLRREVVLEHAQRGFLNPTLATQLVAGLGVDDFGHRDSFPSLEWR